MLQTVSKVGPVLDLFTVDRPEWGVSEVAHALESPKSSAHALLVTLAEVGLLQTCARGRYRLGWRVLALCETVRTGFQLSLRQHARPVIEELAAAIGETVQLGVLERANVLLVDRTVTPREVTVSGSRVGTRRSAHTCALGKALLANRYDDAALRHVLKDIGSDSAGAAAELGQRLARELDDARRTGLSYEYGEAIHGVYGVAACIVDTEGQAIAALGTITFGDRFAAQRHGLERAVMGACSRISRRLSQSEASAQSGWHPTSQVTRYA